MSENSKIERPILFSGPMVRAIMEDRKTQTRRVMKPQPEEKGKELGGGFWWRCREVEHMLDIPQPWNAEHFSVPIFEDVCPYGKLGDRLWVRETFFCVTGEPGPPLVHYRADGLKEIGAIANGAGLWKPSIHMPRWASRLTLEITKVRVERVQDISEADAIAEGCEAGVYTAEDVANLQISDAAPHIKELGRILGPGTVPARTEYMRLWDSINSKRGYGWDRNPWVWVIEFKLNQERRMHQ